MIVTMTLSPEHVYDVMPRGSMIVTMTLSPGSCRCCLRLE